MNAITIFLLFFALMLVAYIVLSIIVKAQTKKKAVHINISYDGWLNGFDPAYTVKAKSFISTLAGVQHNSCGYVIKKGMWNGTLKKGAPLMLIPDPDNQYDSTATRVCTSDGWFIGWLPNKDWSTQIFEDLMAKRKWTASVSEIRKPKSSNDFINVAVSLQQYYKE